MDTLTTTSENCAVHPDRPSAGDCAECGQPACLGCQMTVAGKTVCQSCVAAIRARVAGEMNASTVTGEPPPAPVLLQSQMSAPTLIPLTSTALGIGNVLGGLGLGFLAGIVSTAAWMAFFNQWNFNIAFFAIGVGWLIGVGVVKGSGGHGGNVMALLSAIMAFLFCAAGLLLTLSTDLWGIVFSLLSLFWGVQQAYRTPLHAQ
ncbi:MAG: hypothetical protein H7Z41_07945 [Cytophagales bacterium]|nr:hypothetical protein [Armatimonadota bacterium]